MMPRGPLMVAIAGLELGPADRERLCHPLVGAVILFAANYREPEQVRALCRSIHALREPQLLIAVDHEGGRVQRFREGFTALPPMRRLGDAWDRDPAAARAIARAAGQVIGTELRAVDVDLSLTPVLDLDHGASTIIGDRAFHASPAATADLAGSLIAGLGDVGMAAVGKHFPGHGYIRADSHLELPVDQRSLAEIEAADLVPFARLARSLAGIMPAHVLYPEVDARPAGFSRRWLHDILRTRLGFDGVIFSDDLGMAGAAGEGSLQARAESAIAAGCDMVLACTPEGADQVLAHCRVGMSEASGRRLDRMMPVSGRTAAPALQDDARYRQALATLERLQSV